MHNNLELLGNVVLKALLAKWFESQLKKLRWYGIQKTFVVTVFIGHWSGNCSRYVCGIMFNTNLQRMRQIGVELQQLCVLEALYKQVAVGSIDPFGL